MVLIVKKVSLSSPTSPLTPVLLLADHSNEMVSFPVIDILLWNRSLGLESCLFQCSPEASHFTDNRIKK